MAEFFTKLEGSILQSSVWRLDDETRIVWLTLLAMAASSLDGTVRSSVWGIAKEAFPQRSDADRVPTTERALDRFMRPDPDSRDGTSGERLERVDGGFRLLNHRQKRSRATSVDQHEKEKARKRRWWKNNRAGGKTRRLASSLDTSSLSLSRSDQGEECEKGGALLQRIRDGYADRFEARTGYPPSTEAPFATRTAAVRDWVQTAADATKRDAGELADALLDGFFRSAKARGADFALGWLVTNPAEFLPAPKTKSAAERAHELEMRKPTAACGPDEAAEHIREAKARIAVGLR